MNRFIRTAKTEDAEVFMEIKKQLPITSSDGTTSTGGFLLGTDIESYRFYIQHCYCLVAEVDGKVVGFGIMLDDENLRKSDIWIRRERATWEIDLKKYESLQLCYFEQLAFLKGHSRLVLTLAFLLVDRAFGKNHQILFASTVNRPVTNLAAVPYILAGSGSKAGNIDENYPSIGHINSDIYKIEATQFYAQIKGLAIYPFLEKSKLLLR